LDLNSIAVKHLSRKAIGERGAVNFRATYVGNIFAGEYLGRIRDEHRVLWADMNPTAASKVIDGRVNLSYSIITEYDKFLDSQHHDAKIREGISKA
jgi:hypothetical protein